MTRDINYYKDLEKLNYYEHHDNQFALLTGWRYAEEFKIAQNRIN